MLFFYCVEMHTNVLYVTKVNIIEFIHMNVHPWFIVNLYLIPSLVSTYMWPIFTYGHLV
jgi:hypothetical protein